MSRRRSALIAVAAAAFAGYYALFVATPPGPRSLRAFDPARTAALEVDMWQAYYAKENFRLFRGLLSLTHEQFRYPWAKAARASVHLARAAATFGDLRGDYDQVLPDLEQAYRIARDWTSAGFDPAAVARAELAWWVARRDPTRNAPEQVGRLIAEENSLLYEVPVDRVLDASVLRARAGWLRDQGGAQADWAEVSRLLQESFRQLHAAVQQTAQ